MSAKKKIETPLAKIELTQEEAKLVISLVKDEIYTGANNVHSLELAKSIVNKISAQFPKQEDS
jgi:hypothetical protein